MAIIKSTMKVGEKPPKEVLQRIKEAAKYPINLDDCHELTPEALREFAVMAADRNRQKKRQPVTIRLGLVV
jgi:hypothetical protein